MKNMIEKLKREQVQIDELFEELICKKRYNNELIKKLEEMKPTSDIETLYDCMPLF